MFKLIILLAIIPSLLNAQPCPRTGNGRNAKEQTADSLKNRDIEKSVPETLDISKLLAPGQDPGRFSNDQFVCVTGVIRYIKPGGPESCNCNTADKTKRDLHIYLSAENYTANNKSEMLIVELTPYTFRQFPNYHTAAFQKALIGKKVSITGWLFFDAEHIGVAENTKAPTTSESLIWRKTCWEVHPVTAITFL